MKYHEIRQKLLKMGPGCFTPLEFARATGSSKIAARKLLERYTKKGIFLRLKNGLYAAAENKPPMWAMAGRLYSPSYISLETALSYYGMIPESVYAITSVTSKVTREFTVDETPFLYKKIKRAAFGGYRPIVVEKETVLVAEPAKAVADYLYFAWRGRLSINDRLRWQKVKRSAVLKYVKKFGNVSFERWARDVIGK